MHSICSPSFRFRGACAGIALIASLFLSLCVLGCSNGSSSSDSDDPSDEDNKKAEVSGFILLPASVTAAPYKVIIDSDADGSNGAIQMTSGELTGDTIKYSISEVPAGTYYVYCMVDVDSSGGAPNSGDYFGVYKGKNGADTYAAYFPTSVNATVPSTGTVSFDFSAYSYSAPAGSATVSGTVSLPSSSTGKTYYVVIDTDTTKSTGLSGMAVGTTSGSSISYSIDYIANGTYYVYCFVDIDGDGNPSANDYFGSYGGSGYAFPAAANFSVSSTSATCNFSVALIAP